MNYDPAVIEFTVDELAVVTRPVHGRGGGMQILLRRILQTLNRDTRRASVRPQDIPSCRTYAEYCPGGYETRFRVIVAALERAGR
jgi:hypothetical protein